MAGRQAALDNVFDHFDSTDEGQSGILMDVHSVGFVENWGFGDFQFLKSNPNEQPIETSQQASLSRPLGPGARGIRARGQRLQENNQSSACSLCRPVA